MTEEEYEKEVSLLDWTGILKEWRAKQTGCINAIEWAPGKALEYLILRAFDLERNRPSDVQDVKYPFHKNSDGKQEQQIDGYIRTSRCCFLEECKDKKSKAKESDLSQLYIRVSNRPDTVIGLFFSMGGYTPSAIKSNESQCHIILWDREDIEYCFDNMCFVDCLNYKLDMAEQKSIYYSSYKLYQAKEQEKLITLF